MLSCEKSGIISCAYIVTSITIGTLIHIKGASHLKVWIRDDDLETYLHKSPQEFLIK